MQKKIVYTVRGEKWIWVCTKKPLFATYHSPYSHSFHILYHITSPPLKKEHIFITHHIRFPPVPYKNSTNPIQKIALKPHKLRYFWRYSPNAIDIILEAHAKKHSILTNPFQNKL